MRTEAARREMDWEETEASHSFGQKVPPLYVEIKEVLQEYPDGQVFKVRIDRYIVAGKLRNFSPAPSDYLRPPAQTALAAAGFYCGLACVVKLQWGLTIYCTVGFIVCLPPCGPSREKNPH